MNIIIYSFWNNKIIFFNEGSGVSGTTNPFERKLGRELIEKIQNGEVKNLFFYEWSRLSRDNFFSEYLRKKFIENNVLIYEGDCSESKDLSNPIDQLTSSILSSIYTYERLNMIKRIKEGLFQSRLNQRWGGVYLPYGYKRDKDRNIIVDEVEMTIYLQMSILNCWEVMSGSMTIQYHLYFQKIKDLRPFVR